MLDPVPADPILDLFYALQQAIRGILDEEGFSYEPDEPPMIEVLALSLNVDMVESFIQQSGIFEDFDRAAAQLRQPN